MPRVQPIFKRLEGESRAYQTSNCYGGGNFFAGVAETRRRHVPEIFKPLE